jgi:hypothetical protein
MAVHLTAPQFSAWNEAALRVMHASGAAAIGAALTAALRAVIEFDSAFLATLHRDAPPARKWL